MKIYILSPSFVISDGISRVAQLQAERYGKEGHDVNVITLRTEKKMESKYYKIKKIADPPKNIFLAKIYGALFGENLFERNSYKQLKDADLIMSHFYPMNGLASRAKKKYGMKYIYHHHGTLKYSDFHSLLDRFSISLFWFLVKRSLKNVDEVHAISKTAQEEIFERTGLRSKLVYNHVDEKRFNKKVKLGQVVEKYELKNKKMFFFVGTLTPVKGINYIIEAFKKAKIPNSLLLIGGKTHSEKYLQELRKMVMSDTKIKFVGIISDEELPKLYKAATAYVSGAQAEGFGMPVAEAQACGTPVIVFDAGAHREIVKKGVLIKNRDTDAFAKAMKKLAVK